MQPMGPLRSTLIRPSTAGGIQARGESDDRPGPTWVRPMHLSVFGPASLLPPSCAPWLKAAGRRRNRRDMIGRGRGRRSSDGARCSAQAGTATPCLFRSLDVAGSRNAQVWNQGGTAYAGLTRVRWDLEWRPTGRRSGRRWPRGGETVDSDAAARSNSAWPRDRLEPAPGWKRLNI